MNLLIKNSLFTLFVQDGLDGKYIASEIDPIIVGEFCTDDERWNNGPTRYVRWLCHRIYLIKWNGAFHLIESIMSVGDFAKDEVNSWKEINFVPESIDR